MMTKDELNMIADEVSKRLRNLDSPIEQKNNGVPEGESGMPRNQSLKRSPKHGFIHSSRIR